jgi:hypothetical protein
MSFFDHLPAEQRPFFEWLLSPEAQEGGGYAAALPMTEEMWAGLKPLMFHWTLHTGMIGDRDGYEDRWCYADEARAVAGLIEWAARGFEDEPKGWRRHPRTGRRRNDDGDPASEYIAG